MEVNTSQNTTEVEDLEVTLLLSALEYRWGYDFRDYAPDSIRRRIRASMIRHGVAHISELIPKVLHDGAFCLDIVQGFSVPVTEMFRDPEVWRALRDDVFPMLRTWPYFKIWHAGCATGEEVYSLAILLSEAGLLERATLYATDFNETALQRAREGVFDIKNIQKASHNYFQAGGQHSLNAYYHAQDNLVQMNGNLRQAIVWANHNLVADTVFGEMNLILCRNVMIYFSQELQNRTLELLTSSLALGGYLCLGSKETIDFTRVSSCYEAIAPTERIYRYIDDVMPNEMPHQSPSGVNCTADRVRLKSVIR